MSEQITHLGIADDVRLLALASPRICESVKAFLRAHHDKLRLGAITRGSEGFAGSLVTAIRGRADCPQDGDDGKLAFCLGTMAHRAADRMMKPIFEAQAPDETVSPTSVSIYHDIFIFDRVYGRGAGEPYAPGALSPSAPFPEAPQLDLAAVEGYFRVLLQRTLLSAHTFKPDPGDPEAWLEKLFERLQDLHVDLGRYHQALTNPDEEIIRRAITDVNFYNEGDHVLTLLSELRNGAAIAGEEFLSRCRFGDHDSLYARAVAMAYGYFHITSDYWQDGASESLFLDAIRR